MSGSLSPPRALAIVGPTASGKTSLAIEVARRLTGEVVSMDSRQAYRGFEVGTAAPTAAELEAVVHHGVGFLDPNERFGAGRFVELATEWMRDIESRGRLPMLVGGTGLFLRALTHPMFDEPSVDPRRRAALAAWLDALPVEELVRWATRFDADLSSRSRGPDRQRASRTVELSLLTGAPLSWWIGHGAVSRSPLAVRCYVLELPSEVHRERIRARTRAMLRGGEWQTEVRALTEAGLDRSPAFDALGYSDVAELVEGRITEEEVIERVFAATWAYARRQRTWFRHQLPRDRVVLDGSATPEQLADRIVEDWRSELARRPGPPRDSDALVSQQPTDSHEGS